MSSQLKNSASRFLGRAAIIALLAGSAAGCSSDVTRFGGLFDSTDNRTATVQGTDPMATGSIKPLVGNPTPLVAGGKLPPPPVIAQAPGVPGSVSGWSAAGGTRVNVIQGETVATIARRYGVPEDALLKANNLQPGATLASGTSVVIPVYSQTGAVASTTVPPVVAAPVATAALATKAAGGTYVVQPGDSLGKIANSYGMRSTELAKANGIDPLKPIKFGQKLIIPGAGQVATAAPVKVPKPADAPKPAAVVAAVEPKPTQVPAAPAVDNTQTASINTKPAAVNTGTGVQSAASGNFRWPVRGRVISSYGTQASGERNDGINIEVPEGTPIKASEGGEVIYSGNELKGYGNLVLIKHPNGFVSAYAHASEILVRRGDVVMRGQTIAKVGATGNVDRPQLHFEIRNGNKPVDPIPYMG